MSQIRRTGTKDNSCLEKIFKRKSGDAVGEKLEINQKNDRIEIRVFNHSKNEVGYKTLNNVEIKELFKNIKVDMKKIIK